MTDTTTAKKIAGIIRAWRRNPMCDDAELVAMLLEVMTPPTAEMQP